MKSTTLPEFVAQATIDVNKTISNFRDDYLFIPRQIKWSLIHQELCNEMAEDESGWDSWTETYYRVRLFGAGYKADVKIQVVGSEAYSNYYKVLEVKLKARTEEYLWRTGWNKPVLMKKTVRLYPLEGRLKRRIQERFGFHSAPGNQRGYATWEQIKEVMKIKDYSFNILLWSLDGMCAQASVTVHSDHRMDEVTRVLREHCKNWRACAMASLITSMRIREEKGICLQIRDLNWQ